MLHYLNPLLSTAESKACRSEILEIKRLYNFNNESTGNKKSIDTNNLVSRRHIFDRKILNSIASRVSSSIFLNEISYFAQNQNRFSSFFKSSKFRFFPFYPNRDTKSKEAWIWSVNEPEKLNQEKIYHYFLDCINCNRLPVNITMQLSIIESGGYIAPHTDSTLKLASIMIYLPKDDDQVGTDYGTRFWTDDQVNFINKVSGLSQKESSFMEPKNEYFQSTRYIDTFFGYGTSVLFFRSDTSWHGLSLPKDMQAPRISVNINLVIPPALRNLYDEYF